MPADADRTRVLVVEDRRDLAALYETWLEDEYDVRSVYSGRAALESVAEHGADVVLLDRQLPGLSGDEVADSLDGNGCDAQVVMVTAHSPSPAVADLPVDDYVVKPLRVTQLHSIVETAALIRTYDDDISELLGLLARKQALEADFLASELAASEAFDRLTAEITEREEAAADAVERLWSQSETDLFARLPVASTGGPTTRL
ncbi:response regulator receiver protein [Halorubrum coriense DSM 10284]|uniref:Response regulator receiver protein n=1 Tax=Halorubrum coriense DSM 10284 TaxID=1227466 RepID=M0E8N9_9EURY|nr:response regulator [Halorubrum coriense]ELZ44181.1 response regulator receiver protein [Halorubrum coriense DSM 10284]